MDSAKEMARNCGLNQVECTINCAKLQWISCIISSNIYIRIYGYTYILSIYMLNISK